MKRSDGFIRQCCLLTRVSVSLCTRAGDLSALTSSQEVYRSVAVDSYGVQSAFHGLGNLHLSSAHQHEHDHDHDHDHDQRSWIRPRRVRRAASGQAQRAVTEPQVRAEHRLRRHRHPHFLHHRLPQLLQLRPLLRPSPHQPLLSPPAATWSRPPTSSFPPRLTARSMCCSRCTTC